MGRCSWTTLRTVPARRTHLTILSPDRGPGYAAAPDTCKQRAWSRPGPLCAWSTSSHHSDRRKTGRRALGRGLNAAGPHSIISVGAWETVQNCGLPGFPSGKFTHPKPPEGHGSVPYRHSLPHEPLLQTGLGRNLLPGGDGLPGRGGSSEKGPGKQSSHRPGALSTAMRLVPRNLGRRLRR